MPVSKRTYDTRPEWSVYASFLPDLDDDGKPNADTEFAFIEGVAFVNAAKHEQVVARHVAEVERLREALLRARVGIAELHGCGFDSERKRVAQRLHDEITRVLRDISAQEKDRTVNTRLEFEQPEDGEGETQSEPAHMERSSTLKTWANLTVKQRTHLIRACSQGLNPADKTLDVAVVKALREAGLIHRTMNKKGRVLWRPTDAGRGLVASRGLIPTFLHRRSQYGYTHSSHQAMFGEPEVMDDAA